MHLSSDCKFLTINSWIVEFIVINLETRSEVGRCGSIYFPNILALTHNNKYVVIQSSSIYLWSLESESIVWIWDPYHASDLRMTLSQDHKFILGYRYDMVSIWDIDTKELLSAHHADSFINIATLSKDNKYVAVAGECGLIQVIDVISWRDIFKTTGGSQPISLALSDDNEYIAVGNNDYMSVFRLDTKEEVANTNKTIQQGSVFFLGDQDRIVYATKNQVYLHDLKNGQVLESENSESIYSIYLTQEEDLLMFGKNSEDQAAFFKINLN